MRVIPDTYLAKLSKMENLLNIFFERELLAFQFATYQFILQLSFWEFLCLYTLTTFRHTLGSHKGWASFHIFLAYLYLMFI